MPELPSDCPERSTPPDPWGIQASLPPLQTIRSVEPGDKVCDAVLQERARRKEEDEGIFRQLDSIRAGVDTTRKLTGRVAVGVAAIIMAAALEYMGVLGNGTPPVWARVVIDVLGTVLGK
jgi:hypothetical protein